MKYRHSLSLALAVGSLLVGTVALPATAAPRADDFSSTYSVPECVTQVKAAIAEGTANGATVKDCVVTTALDLSDSYVVTPAEIQSSTSLTDSEKSTLVVAAAAGAIIGKHWSQYTTGVAYTRTHNGTFYYNGSRVWVTTTYLGYKGSHNCFTNYSVGFNITGGSCNESGSTTSRALYSNWDVNPNGTFIHYNVSMTATVKYNGTISGYGATVG